MFQVFGRIKKKTSKQQKNKLLRKFKHIWQNQILIIEGKIKEF